MNTNLGTKSDSDEHLTWEPSVNAIDCRSNSSQTGRVRWVGNLLLHFYAKNNQVYQVSDSFAFLQCAVYSFFISIKP